MSNLLTDPWLPVTAASGNTQTVPPHQLVACNGETIIDFHAPRADFKGAIFQLLLALLQCRFAPANREQWERYWQQPPDTDTLREAFAPVAPIFEIFSDSGPAFMQDSDLSPGSDVDIANLLIDASEGHFNKPGTVQAVAPHWAAVALFTLQINAPAGGRGHRVSLRGGGPLTTLVIPPTGSDIDTLWHRLWLNVLTLEELKHCTGNIDLEEPSATYPWAGPVRVSEKKGSETYPKLAHPLHMYWSMPRRVRFAAPESGAFVCDLSGESCTQVVRAYTTKSYGHNYEGNWLHPLTPHVYENGKETLTVKGQPGGIGYRHWLGTVLSTGDEKRKRVVAGVVAKYQERRRWVRRSKLVSTGISSHPQLWVFGYDMDNMKARCWYETTLPLLTTDSDRQDALVEDVGLYINAAEDARRALVSGIKQAWFSRPKDAKGDMSAIGNNFWERTEASFYAALQRLISGERAGAAHDWHTELRQISISLFEQYAIHDASASGSGYRKAIQARDGKGGLVHNLNRSKAMKAIKAMRVAE
jgi:CRISPR system Cascade subunit CasA